MKILVIDDSQSFTDELKMFLSIRGFSVDVENDPITGVDVASDEAYDVIILDVIMPGISGFETCKRIRSNGVITPILMLTAISDKNRIVYGLDSGADDYLTKPFDYPELISRLNALIRRSKGFVASELSTGKIKVNQTEQKAYYKDYYLDLTTSEYKLVELLVLNSGIIVSKDSMISHLWDSDSEIYSNVIEVMISRIRTKIRQTGECDEVIKTVRGRGYILEKE